MRKFKAILILPEKHKLAPEAIAMVSQYMELVAVFDQASKVTEAEIVDIEHALLLNFLANRIFKKEVLERPNVNFHPAPPEYPGRGGASYAIFDKSETYGATAHRMVRAVDAGEIYLVNRFIIQETDSCERLFEKAERACVTLLTEIIEHFAKTGAILKNADAKWQHKATTRKHFDEWLKLDPENEEEFHLKIKAARHSRFPGPFITIHGYTFALYEKKPLERISSDVS